MPSFQMKLLNKVSYLNIIETNGELYISIHNEFEYQKQYTFGFEQIEHRTSLNCKKNITFTLLLSFSLTLERLGQGLSLFYMFSP